MWNYVIPECLVYLLFNQLIKSHFQIQSVAFNITYKLVAVYCFIGKGCQIVHKKVGLPSRKVENLLFWIQIKQMISLID